VFCSLMGASLWLAVEIDAAQFRKRPPSMTRRPTPGLNRWNEDATGVPECGASAARTPDLRRWRHFDPVQYGCKCRSLGSVLSKWSAAGNMHTPRGTSCNGFVLPFTGPLNTGAILAAGGLDGSCSAARSSTATAELFEPTSETLAHVGR
jgi:hypothetical protein